MARWTSDCRWIGRVPRFNDRSPENEHEARSRPLETGCLGSRGLRSGVDWCREEATAGAGAFSFRDRILRVEGVGHDAKNKVVL
jgi:hypothetical protein